MLKLYCVLKIVFQMQPLLISVYNIMFSRLISVVITTLITVIVLGFLWGHLWGELWLDGWRISLEEGKIVEIIQVIPEAATHEQIILWSVYEMNG